MVQRKPNERAQDRDRIQFTDAPDQVHTIEPISDTDSGDGSGSDAQYGGTSHHVDGTNFDFAGTLRISQRAGCSRGVQGLG